MSDPDELDLAAFRARLEARRAALLAAGEETAGDRAPVELDQSRVGRLSRMDALQGREMAEAGERRRRAELQRIEAALRRIEEDEYGWCVRCGEPIAQKRLEADPSTPTCLACAA